MFEKMKVVFRNQVTKFLIVFIFGIIISSVYFLVQVKTLQSRISNKNQREEQLNAHIKQLSDRYRNPPTPTPQTANIATTVFQQTDKINYEIECYDFAQKKPNLPYLEKIENKIKKTEKITYLCFNEQINKVVFVTKEDVVARKNRSATSFNFRLKIFNLDSNVLNDIKVSQGSYLGAWCGKITNWSVNSYVYYQCSGGDGPWNVTTTYKVNEFGKEESVVEYCSQFGKKEYCSRYCNVENPCQAGSFCNLNQNNCIQSCQDFNDCGNRGYGACRPYGPVMGCGL